MVCEHDLIDFIRDRFPYYKDYTDGEIHSIILQHINYGTISILKDKEKFIGLLRINISGSIANVEDMAVADGYKALDVIRQMSMELWFRFPYLKYFKFYRILKYPLKKPRIYTIKRLMKVK